jgi:hypothetical protein
MLFLLKDALYFVRTAMKSLSVLVIFVALATVFHQSSSFETDIRDEILKAHDKAKERLGPLGKSKGLVSTIQTSERIVTSSETVSSL